MASYAAVNELAKLREISAQEVANATLREDISSAVIEALPDAIVVADQEGKIFLVNREAELCFGYSRKELFGQIVDILLPETVREKHVGHRQGYLAEPRTRVMGSGLQLFGRRKDGKEFAAEISLSPLPTERGLFVITIIRRKRSDG